MIYIIKVATALLLLACSTFPASALANETDPLLLPFEPYEEMGWIGPSHLETSLRHPWYFRDGTWIQIALDEADNLLVCVVVHGMGECLFTHQPPHDIHGSLLDPNCQGDGTLAFTATLLREPQSDLLIYFVDGYLTFDREEAEAWANETEGCTFDTLDLEW